MAITGHHSQHDRSVQALLTILGLPLVKVLASFGGLPPWCRGAIPAAGLRRAARRAHARQQAQALPALQAGWHDR